MIVVSWCVVDFTGDGVLSDPDFTFLTAELSGGW